MPPRGNMMGPSEQVFIEVGTAIFQAIEAKIQEYKPEQPIETMEILDFGCGVGRVALPFFYKHRRPTACVDVMPEAIGYLRDVIPEAHPILGPFLPPLPYPDDAFDAIYAISVWTHLNPEAATAWLTEMARLLKPGGLALLSTASHSQLAIHREHRRKLWADVSDDVFNRQGMVFRGRHAEEKGGVYGIAVHTPEWIKSEWSKVIPVKESRVRAVAGAQDLNILVKPHR
jgi:SAM-dependent methyltransferase